jgi:parallel beta-helix repeat protein
MGKKIVAIWLSLVMVFGFVVIVDVIIDFTSIVRGSSTLYVNETGSDGAFTSIQDAINASNDGDTVYVYNGTYYENVVVNRSINLNGEDRNSTIVNGGGTGIVVYVTADWVNITSFTITNGIYGLYLDSSSNNNIINNNVSNNEYGIELHSSLNNNITDNNVYSNNRDGLRLFSSNNNISGNDVYSNIQDGIYLSASSNNITDNNVYSNNEHGIQLTSSSNNNIRGNNVLSNNRYGIYLWYSLNINITNNNLTDDGVVIVGTSIQHFNSHTIPDNNIVNGKPLYYKKDCSNISIDGIPIGQLILVNCTNVSVTNLQITMTDVGIDVVYSTNISFGNNTISSNNHHGIYLGSSSNNTILYNNISNNGDDVSFPIGKGIMLSYSSNNNIKNNTISSNGFYGIYFYFSSNNNITNNTFSLNYGRGIEVGLSSNNNNITNNNISSNKWGIYLSSSNNNLTNNNVSSNINGGVYLWSSSNSKITNNNVYSNGNYGIKLGSSSNNKIYHNNIIDNTNQAYDDRNDNSWDNGHPSGGNYWSDFDESSEGAFDDYQGPNQNVLGSDGIVDNGSVSGGGKNPYIIDVDSQDNYPLIYPIGNYIFLYEGWNLISIPFIQSDTNLSSVLNSITGSYKAVQWYNATDSNDHWKHNSISKPSELNDLDSINHKMGFWIYITEPGGVLFQYFGIQPTENQTITLHPDWNLVGYPSLRNKNRTNALNNLTFSNDVDSIWTYKAETQKWYEIGEFDYFELGRGYWVHSKVKKTWEVPL